MAPATTRERECTEGSGFCVVASWDVDTSGHRRGSRPLSNQVEGARSHWTVAPRRPRGTIAAMVIPLMLATLTNRR